MLLVRSGSVEVAAGNAPGRIRRGSALDGKGLSPASAGGNDPWSFGVEVLDRALPAGGLAPDGVHEGSGRTRSDGPAASAFLLAILTRLPRNERRNGILVCQGREPGRRQGRPYGPGWQDMGLDPGNLLLVRADRDREVLWAVEESLRSATLTAVVAEVGGLDFVASRRLSLAAREGQTPALLLRHDGFRPTSAARTRWRIGTCPGRADPLDARSPGTSAWQVDLVRSHGGRPVDCTVEWDHETGDFRLVAALAD